eukprot:1379728-Prymnesium_polylepis.1
MAWSRRAGLRRGWSCHMPRLELSRAEAGAVTRRGWSCHAPRLQLLATESTEPRPLLTAESGGPMAPSRRSGFGGAASSVTSDA